MLRATRRHPPGGVAKDFIKSKAVGFRALFTRIGKNWNNPLNAPISGRAFMNSRVRDAMSARIYLGAGTMRTAFCCRVAEFALQTSVCPDPLSAGLDDLGLKQWKQTALFLVHWVRPNMAKGVISRYIVSELVRS